MDQIARQALQVLEDAVMDLRPDFGVAAAARMILRASAKQAALSRFRRAGRHYNDAYGASDDRVKCGTPRWRA